MKKILLNSISVATTMLVLFSCKEESLNLSPFRRICNQTAPEKGICYPQQKGRANGEGCKSLYSKQPDYKSARTDSEQRTENAFPPSKLPIRKSSKTRVTVQQAEKT